MGMGIEIEKGLEKAIYTALQKGDFDALHLHISDNASFNHRDKVLFLFLANIAEMLQAIEKK